MSSGVCDMIKKKPKPAEPVRTTMRLEPELKEALEKAAAEDKRNVTSMTSKILSDWLKEKGYLK
jgi:hypothetical protein